jgi:hypothetical protein
MWLNPLFLMSVINVDYLWRDYTRAKFDFNEHF